MLIQRGRESGDGGGGGAEEGLAEGENAGEEPTQCLRGKGLAEELEKRALDKTRIGTVLGAMPACDQGSSPRCEIRRQWTSALQRRAVSGSWCRTATPPPSSVS